MTIWIKSDGYMILECFCKLLIQNHNFTLINPSNVFRS